MGSRGDVNPANDTAAQQVYVLPVIYQTDFESGLGRWTGDWALTDESANSGSHSLTDWPHHNYPLNSDRFSALDTLFNMTPYSSITLSFSNCHWIEPGYDFGYVMVSADGGVHWDSVASYTGVDSVWHNQTVDLSGYHTSSGVKLGFRMGSDALLNMKGWLIDDVVLTASATKELGAAGTPAAPAIASALTQIAPNPCAGHAGIRFQVGRSGSRVSLRVYNLAGQLVRTLHDGAMDAGSHRMDLDGSRLSAGVYFVRLTVGGFAATKRLTVLR